jgi:ornithine decarboxylase
LAADPATEARQDFNFPNFPDGENLSIFFTYITIGYSTLQNLQAIIHSFRSDYGAFYVFAGGRVQASWNLWCKELPRIRPFYAVKCNPERALLQQLASFGAGFDCASGRELMEVVESCIIQQPGVLNKGNFFQRVVYANPCKPNRDLLKAKALGSPTTVVDSCEEIDKLKSVDWQGGALVRLLVDDKGSLMPFSSKFGISPQKIKDIAAYAKRQGIDLKGVSFHVGSGCQDGQQYKKALGDSHASINAMNEAGHSATIVDIGGGFLPELKKFEDHAEHIRSGMRFVQTKAPIQYIGEPGRFFADNAFDLFVQVIGKKPSLDGEGWRYTIDESLYGQFSCIPFDHKKPTWARIPLSYQGGDYAPRRRVKGTLFGRTCDSMDMIAKSESMEELEVGDWLWFPNMGAYTSVTASEFNGFPKPPLHGIEKHVFLPDFKDMHIAQLQQRLPAQVSTVSAVALPMA